MRGPVTSDLQRRPSTANGRRKPAGAFPADVRSNDKVTRPRVAVPQQLGMRAAIRQRDCPVDDLVAEPPRQFVDPAAQSLGRRPVGADDPMLGVQDEDQVRHGVERPLPDGFVGE